MSFLHHHGQCRDAPGKPNQTFWTSDILALATRWLLAFVSRRCFAASGVSREDRYYTGWEAWLPELWKVMGLPQMPLSQANGAISGRDDAVARGANRSEGEGGLLGNLGVRV